MEDQNDDSHHTPTAVKTGAIKADFIRLIPGPDDQKLRKAEISPKHQECQQQFAEIMKMTALDEPRHGGSLRKENQNANHQGQSRDSLPRDENKTIDCREPVR